MRITGHFKTQITVMNNRLKIFGQGRLYVCESGLLTSGFPVDTIGRLSFDANVFSMVVMGEKTNHCLSVSTVIAIRNVIVLDGSAGDETSQ